MAPKDRYDVIIVGAGPAGLFAALELARAGDAKVLLIEKGRDLPDRSHDDPASILCGWGGAGAYSDGKLNLSCEIGGQLQKIVGHNALESLIQEVDRMYVDFGASDNVYGGDTDAVIEFQRRAAHADLKLISTRIRHIGTEVCLDVLGAIREELLDRIEFLPDTPVDSILTGNGRVTGVELAGGGKIHADSVIAAPGREGSEWLAGETKRLGLAGSNNPVDVGVRVEVPAAIMAPITDELYESKFVFASKSFDDEVRTFCMCPRGEVVLEQNNGLITVNGHSYSTARTDRHTQNTNFAVLVSTRFTEPFDQPITYGRYVASLANMLGKGVIVQRLGDLRAGRRSTPKRIEKGTIEPSLKEATPGDLSFVLPYRYLTGILEMLEALDNVAPGINSRFTLLYGVEVKFYSTRVELDEELETKIKNLYAIGDGAGITRGLVQASASGLVAARSIIKKSGKS